MKQDPEFFNGQEPELIYIAKRLDDALALEKVLTDAQVDYGVEADQFVAGVVFRSERVGAFFYVLPRDRERARALAADAGFKPL